MLIFFFYSLFFSFILCFTSLLYRIQHLSLIVSRNIMFCYFHLSFFRPLTVRIHYYVHQMGAMKHSLVHVSSFLSGYLYKTDSLILSLVGLFVHWFARKNNDYPGLLHFNFSLSIHLNYEFMHIQPMVSTNNNIGWLDF